MPYKSDAQRRKFHAMLNRGEISAATVAHWDKATKGKKLPERVAIAYSKFRRRKDGKKKGIGQFAK